MRKDLIIAVLVTFCLTTALFMIIPTSSSPTVGKYDPWLDYNDDGAINFLDAILLGASFGTTGDPTKQVIIAGHNYQIISHEVTILPGIMQYINITTAGYEQITVYFIAVAQYGGNISVATAFLIDYLHGYTEWFTVSIDRINPPPYYYPGQPARVEKTYSVKAPTLVIACYNPNNYNVTLYIEAYLTT